MSIRELFREFVAAKRKARLERERDICLAWNTAALVGSAWAGKLPKLETLLAPLRAKAPLTQHQRAEQHRAALSVLAERYGIPLRARKKVKK